jgi:hypothetical protein
MSDKFADDLDDKAVASIKANTPKRRQWKTQDGRLLYIDEMQDNHLLNAHRKVSESLRELQKEIIAAYSVSSMFSGEMAIDCALSSIGTMEDGENILHKAVRVLRNEIEKRGLKPLPLREPQTKLSA